MEFTEEYYMEQFGLTDERESPSEENDTQTEMSKETGENTQEPAEDVREQDTQPEVADPEEADAGASHKTKQSRSQNRKFAAARRQAEAERDQAIQDMEAQIAAAREEGRREGQKDLLQRAGLENPYTNEKISTMDEFDKYESAHREMEQQQRLRDMDMTQEQYDKFIAELPEVKAARELAEQSRQKQVQQRLDAEIAAIGKLNPAIQSAEDLKQDDRYDDLVDKIRQNPGMSLNDAYVLVHLDDLTSARGRQQAINQAGKRHMQAMRGRTENSVAVPSDELAMFRAMDPTATDDQISKFYNKMIQNE